MVAPSILSADLLTLGEEIRLINESKADWIHFDVMDGVFVPNLSFGIPLCEAIKKVVQKPIDVHLMVVQPEKLIPLFASAGASYISVHYETVTHLHRTISQIKELGCKAGVAINPHTPIHILEDIITDLDYVCVMSVNPGYSGQKFIENTFRKVVALRNLIDARQANTLIQVDGGINTDNGKELVKAGADILVAANFIYKSDDKLQAIASLRNLFQAN